MDRCDGPFVRKTDAYMNTRSFAATRGLKWSKGVNIAPGEYYKGCTLMVKDVVDGKAAYRKFVKEDVCYDAILRCDVDATEENVCWSGRECVIISGEVFADAIVDLPEDCDPACDIESNCPAVLSIRSKICSGLGKPTDEERTSWGLE